jgi:hypothetical protein
MPSTLVVRFAKFRLGIMYRIPYMECVYTAIMNVNKEVKVVIQAEMGMEVGEAAG